MKMNFTKRPILSYNLVPVLVMLCAEHQSLLEELTRLVAAYQKAFDRLQHLPAGAEFDELWQEAGKVREARDSARCALIEHEKQHQCVEGPRLHRWSA
jgi:hypothetical protein